jgi:hypothetical protein
MKNSNVYCAVTWGDIVTAGRENDIEAIRVSELRISYSFEAQRTTSYISTEVTADFNFSVKGNDLNLRQKYR